MRTALPHLVRAARRLAMAAPFAAYHAACPAADALQLGDARLSYGATLTLGQSRRDSDRNPEVINRINAQAVGATGLATGGRNQDDGNLNFGDGDPFSTVLKLHAQGRLERGAFALVLSGKAWYDDTLENKAMPWGNLANGLRGDRPLSDAGFDRRSRFSGAVLQEAYAELAQGLGEHRVVWRLGQQLIGWGEPSLLGGGLRQIDAQDLPGSRRPGAIAAENQAPAPALRATLQAAGGWRADGFVMLGFVPNASTVCGTFYSVADYLDGDCDKVILGANANDRDNLAAGSYLKRSGIVKPSGSGQYGLSLGYAPPGGIWRAAVYAADVHNRAFNYNMIKSRRSGNTVALPNDPGGLNPMYELEYAEHVHVVAADASLTLGDSTWQAELTHSPNLPVPLNAGDLVGAFASTLNTPSLLRADERATAPGGRYRGYDRLSVSDLRIGVSRQWRNLMGAETLQLRVEAAGKFVHDLPDVNLRRYRRPDVYGNGPVNGVCTGAADSKQCSNDGYVTARAWGLRMRLSAGWRVGPGWLLSPSLAFGQDLKGWSFDNALGEGRRTLGLGLRLAAGKAFGELSTSRVWGNPFDNAGDRDAITLVAGWQF